MFLFAKRTIRLLSSILVSSLFFGALPWREIRADMNTHGEYDAYPLSIIYEQVSTGDNSTQGEFTLTNDSEFEITSWTIEVDYFEDVTLSNIWDAADITTEEDENLTYQVMSPYLQVRVIHSVL